MIFYAPLRGVREVRDKAGLAPAGLVALLAHAAFFLSITWFYTGYLITARRPFAILMVVLQSAGFLVYVALIFSPLTLFLANIFERRASFRLLIQQEYSALAATMFYALTAASLITTILTVAASLSGVQLAMAQRFIEWFVARRNEVRP